MAFLETLIWFLISLIVSTVIVYFATKIFGETEGFGTAILTAFIGSIIYALAYFFLGTGWLAAIIAGVAWLIALGTLYKMGWLKSLAVAVVIWLIAWLVSYLLPTLTGPL